MVGSLLCAMVAPAALGTLSAGPEPATWAPADAIRRQRLNAGLWGLPDEAPVELRQDPAVTAAFPATTPALTLPLEACAARALAPDEPAAVMLPAEPLHGFGRALAAG